MSNHPAKFDGHCHFGSEVMMHLVCHVILQDHLIKESCDFMGASTSWQETSLSAKFGSYRHCASVDIMSLVAERKIPDALASICHYCCVSHY